MKTLLMRFATEGLSFKSSKVPPLLLFLRLILRCLYISERAAMVKQLKPLEFRKRHPACKLNKSNTHDNVSDDIIRDLQNLQKDICLPPTVLHPWCFHWAVFFFFFSSQEMLMFFKIAFIEDQDSIRWKPEKDGPY
jgi:hypothetical protein